MSVCWLPLLCCYSFRGVFALGVSCPACEAWGGFVHSGPPGFVRLVVVLPVTFFFMRFPRLFSFFGHAGGLRCAPWLCSFYSSFFFWATRPFFLLWHCPCVHFSQLRACVPSPRCSSTTLCPGPLGIPVPAIFLLSWCLSRGFFVLASGYYYFFFISFRYP